MMNVEQSVESELAGETEVLGENLPQCHYVHYKSHMTWPGLEPGLTLKQFLHPLYCMGTELSFASDLQSGYSWSPHVGTTTNLTEVYRGFPRPLQANLGIVPQLGYDSIFPRPFQLIIRYHPAITPWDTDTIIKGTINN
jgi:hypothetical protein